MPITNSVGRNGVNLPREVQYVQALLNVDRTDRGLPALDLDGKLGQLTIDAIENFQSVVTGFVDGLVEPDKTAIDALEASVSPIGGEVQSITSLALVLSYEPVQQEPPDEAEPVTNDSELMVLVQSIVDG